MEPLNHHNARADEREALLPCPFCGSRLIGMAYTGQPARQIFASCFDCKATGPAQHYSEGMTFDWDAAWNRRAALATAPEQVGEPFAYWWNDLGEGGKAKKVIGFVPPPYIPTSALNALYTAPPPASTNRLTDEQIIRLAVRHNIAGETTDAEAIAFARAIIAATEAK